MNNNFTPPDYSEIQRRLKNESGPSYWGGYIKPGIYSSSPTQKKSFSGRILPMFNYGLSPADSEFPKSWAPYRNSDKIDQETGQPVLSAFFGVASCYSWFGAKPVSFLSPVTRKYTTGETRGMELVDPIQDIRNYAKKHNDPAIRALTERDTNKKESKSVIPYPSLRYFFNFYGTAGPDRNLRNYVIDVSKKAFEDLSLKLSEWRPAHEQIVDTNWSDYLLGDITNPNTGLMIDTVAIPDTPQPFNGFIFTSGSHKSLKGTRSMAVPEDALTKRAHFYGADSAFKIMAAQEIVDFLVEDGTIPYNLIQEVCSHYCNVPPQTKRNTVVSAPSESEDESAYVPPMPIRNMGYSAPAPAPSAPPPPEACEVSYWLSVGGASPAKHTHSEVTHIMNGGPKGQVRICKVGESDWKTPEQFGFSVLSDSPPPADNGSAPPPWTAPAVAVSAAPVVQAKPVAASNSGLSEVEQQELDAYQMEFGKLSMNMDTERLSKMVSLRLKAGFNTAVPE